jgi:hypothetical protein
MGIVLLWAVLARFQLIGGFFVLYRGYFVFIELEHPPNNFLDRFKMEMLAYDGGLSR